jgi:alginate O-acetyltransferase complex protein AlgI
MLFTTGEYVLFLAAVVTLYWLTPFPRVRVWILLVASYAFYASWNKWLALLIAATSVADYFIGRGMDASSRPGLRKALLLGSLVMNLGLLCYFKYANFFLRSLEDGLRAAGASASFPVLSVILPVGISFYTFEAINYTVDVYRRRIRAERDLSHFVLFILFFPHLVAGPIVRARDFLRQAHRPKRWSWVRAQHGLQLIVLGLFKKLAIADCMAIYSDRVWVPGQDIAALNSGAAWMAVIAFTVRIYCDFSGYSDIALGCAHLLGYKLTVNFRMPYISANIAEFWRRWHISLSNWLRDYIFIPLGGSRGGFWTTARNLTITFGLGGLWHGATWSWVVWGLLMAFMLIVHRAFRLFCETKPTLQWALETRPGTVLRIAVTLFFVTLSMVFAQPSIQTALAVLHKMFVPSGGVGLPMDQNRLWWTVYLVVFAHLVAALGVWAWVWRRLPGPVLGAACALVFVAAQVLSPDTTKAFVYFVF